MRPARRRRAGLAAHVRGRELTTCVEDLRDLLARLRRERLRLAGLRRIAAEHVLEHVRALDVRPVRGRRHEPARLRRLGERRQRRLRRVDPRERRRVRDHAARGAIMRLVRGARERGDPVGRERLVLARDRDRRGSSRRGTSACTGPWCGSASDRRRSCPSSAGFPSFGSSAYGHSQPLPMNEPTLPLAKTSACCGCASSPVLFARESLSAIVRQAVRPASACGESSVPTHLPFFVFAICAAEVVDERHRGVPVAAREVDGRVGRILLAAELRHQLVARGHELGQRLRRRRDPGRLVLVGAVDDAAGAGVVRARRTSCRCSAGLGERRQPGPRVREVGLVERRECAGRAVLRRVGVAELDHVRRVPRRRASPRTSSCSRPSPGTGR